MTLSCISMCFSQTCLRAPRAHHKRSIALVIPAAYHSAKSHYGGVDNSTLIFPDGFDFVSDGSDLENVYADGLKVISRGTAILLLIVYVAYLYFQVGGANSLACMNIMLIPPVRSWGRMLTFTKSNKERSPRRIWKPELCRESQNQK